jgi:transcriptional regulator with XRE-family HTH domain
MSSSEPFNFGRKIKELKKLHKKGYADLTAGLKISRERIIALEEGEREPTEVERQRFAAFYNMPVEEFQPRQVSVPAPRPAAPVNTAPLPQQRPVATNPAPRPPAPRPAPKQVNDQGDIKDVSPNDPKPVMKYTAEQLGDIESAYLRKQRDLKVALTFTFLNGKEYTGVVVDFTPFTIHIIEEATKEEVILRKLAVAYYRKSDALTEKETEKGS